MKRVYEVVIGASKEVATEPMTVIRPNIISAISAAMGAYRRLHKKDKLWGHLRVVKAVEIGQVDA